MGQAAVYPSSMSKPRDHAALEQRRKKAGILFNKGYSAPEVARRFGVADKWLIAGRTRGNRAAKAPWPVKVQPGRKPKLTGEQTHRVTEALLTGPAAQGYKTDLWTLPRVAALIEDLTGVRYHPGHVWRLMGASGFSCQRPERRAMERDEKAIRRWQRVGWPALKKSPPAKTDHRIHR